MQPHNFTSGPQLGLTAAQAAESARTHGRNVFNARKQKGFFRSFLSSFGDPMIRILLIALAINIIFLFRDNNWFETIGVALAILIATVVGTISEYGSEAAFARLQEEAARINCRVYRDGILTILPVEEIVVGDIILLGSGEKVPADGEILRGQLDIDQASITGEAEPRRSDVSESIYSGTVVCTGEGVMRATAVGTATMLGKIGDEIQGDKRISPMKIRLGGLAKRIGKIGICAAIFTVLAYFFNTLLIDNNFEGERIMQILTDRRVMFGHILRALTLAVTVVVMAVPEGLPMMITVVLSSNMKRMQRDNVLVRKLVGIETAGSLNILFTDKTGTLTKGRPEVASLYCAWGTVDAQDAKSLSFKFKELLYNSIIYNSSAEVSGGRIIGGNSTDRAVVGFTNNMEYDSGQSNVSVIKRTPFDSKVKYMATEVMNGKTRHTYIKGAPERILSRCNRIYDKFGAIVTLSEANRIEIADAMRNMADDAKRLLAIAVSETTLSGEEFSDLILIALIGIRDEIRPEAAQGVSDIRGAGIQVVMITGDQKNTAAAIARETGIILPDENAVCITSEELAALNDKELTEILPRLRVVARALPSDKSRLVRVAQGHGLVTGMTGDGVNDAPALKAADIAFAMGSGTEVAKEAGDIVILDDNINSISKAICYGRTIFKSIRKFVIYQLSICMSAVGITVISPLLGVDMPITVVQLLWINMVMDTLAGIAFSGEKSRKKYMSEPPKSRDEPIINKYMITQIATTAVYLTCLCLFFLTGPFARQFPAMYNMTAFFALFMFCAIFSSFNARTHSINLADYIAANKPFLGIMGIVTITQICIIYFGGPVFRTAGLAPQHLLMCVILAATVIPIDLLRKFILRKLGKWEMYSGT